MNKAEAELLTTISSLEPNQESSSVDVSMSKAGSGGVSASKPAPGVRNECEEIFFFEQMP